MTIYSKVSGVWKTIDDPQVKVSGVWKDVQTAYVKVSGAWKEIYNRVVVSITNQTIVFGQISPNDAYARYQLDSDGKVYEYTGTTAGTPTTFIENWVDPTSEASNYECFATLNSGSLQTGTTGSWLALTSDRMWGVAVTGIGTQTANLTIDIREVGTATNLASATISLEASVEP
jgi:hypothetical protein